MFSRVKIAIRFFFMGLAVGILLVRPELQMPALSRFVDGTGPIFAGKIFPFCFITIACGAISGFHALISSGTTPKMLAREGRTKLAQACFDFLPHRAELDLAGWDDIDIFAHS